MSQQNGPRGREASVLDARMLANLQAEQRPGMPNFVVEAIKIYLESGAGRLQALHDAVAQDDPEALAYLARGFRSDSANLGATGLAELLRDLEVMGYLESTDLAAETLIKVEQEYADVCEALKAVAVEETVGN